MPRPLRLAALLAAALLAPAVAGDPVPPARAEGGAPAGKAPAPTPSPGEAYAARLKEVGPKIASALERAAAFAMRNRLARSGLNVFQQMKEFDPGNEKANRELGYERKGEEWVPNEARRKKLDEAEDESAKKEPEFLKLLKEGQVGAARMLAELGELAEKAGSTDDARAHWKRSLGLDDQNPLANQKMGNHLVDGKWLTDRAVHFREFQKAYRETLDKAQKLAVSPVPAADSTGIAEKAGIPIKRYKTNNFRIESNHSDGDIKSTLVWLERAREFYLRLFEVPDRLLDYSADPMVFVIVLNEEEKNRLVDACDGIPPEMKNFKKKFTGIAVGGKLDLRLEQNGPSAEKHCIHTATHSMVRDTMGQHAPWLGEALANAVSAAVKEADLTVCFSGEGSTGGIHLENISLEQAPLVLRALVKAKKDTPMAEFVGLPSDGMTAQQIAKSWSVVMFLLERDRLQAREYFASAGQGNGGDRSKDDRVLRQYFEDYGSWKALDDAWREWALDVYKQ